jgi:F0F1-type ATP synthase assembly protein I
MKPSMSVLLLLGLCAGCTNFNSAKPGQVGNVNINTTAIGPEQIQSELMTFADTHNTRLVDALNRYEEVATTQKDRIWAMRTRYFQVAATLSHATEINPAVGVVDMLFMVSAKRIAMQRPGGMPADATLVLEAMAASEAEIRRVAARVFTDAEVKEIDELIERWAADNPDQLATARTKLSDFARLRYSGANQINAQLPTSIFRFLYLDPLAGLDPVAREIRSSRLFAERSSFLLQRMPGLIGWQAKLVAQESLALPEVGKLLGSIELLGTAGKDLRTTADRAVDQSGRFIDEFAKVKATTDDVLKQTTQLAEQSKQWGEDFQRISKTVEAMPALVTSEREAAIKQALAGVDDQRAKLMRDLDAQQQSIRAVAEGVDKTARETRESLAASVAQLKSTVDNAKSTGTAIVDAIFWRALILIGVVLVGLPISVAIASRLKKRVG